VVHFVAVSEKSPLPPFNKGGAKMVPLLKGGPAMVPLLKGGPAMPPLLKGGPAMPPLLKGAARSAGGFCSDTLLISWVSI
jgi:hypothetical protein